MTALALAVRGGAQAPRSSQPALCAAHIAKAAPGTAQATPQTERSLTPPDMSYTAIGPAEISIQSPSDATISPPGTAVYRITIKPADATIKYYVCISSNSQTIVYYNGTKPQPLPYAILFEAGIMQKDVTLQAAVGTLPGTYEVFAYKYGEFNTDYSAPLIVEDLVILSGIGQSIPTSCTVADNPIQAGVEGFDCTASVKGLYAAAPPEALAIDVSSRKPSIPPTIVEVDCSERKMYHPGKGLIACRKKGSNGWPARLKFPPHRRQARFSVEHSKDTVVSAAPVVQPPTVQLIFYSIKYSIEDNHKGEEMVSRSFSKPIRIVTVKMPSLSKR